MHHRASIPCDCTPEVQINNCLKEKRVVRIQTGRTYLFPKDACNLIMASSSSLDILPLFKSDLK